MARFTEEEQGVTPHCHSGTQAQGFRGPPSFTRTLGSDS